MPINSKAFLSNVERFLGDNELIVSKTDLKGNILYANNIFCDIADYELKEVLAQPHSMVRHPKMPRTIFYLLWDALNNGREIFVYVVNRGKLGDHYWVFAHVTPSYNANGEIVGYHSNRRKPKQQSLEKVSSLYERLLAIELSHQDRKQGMQAGIAELNNFLQEQGMCYDEFILSI